MFNDANFSAVQFVFTKLVNHVDDIVSVNTRAAPVSQTAFSILHSHGGQVDTVSYSPVCPNWEHKHLLRCQHMRSGFKAHSPAQPPKKEQSLAEYISDVQETYDMMFPTVRHRAR